MIQSSTSTYPSDTHELVTNMTRKGQVTVPADVRRKLKLTEHDRFTVTIENGSEIRLRRKHSVAQATFGVVSSTGTTADLDALRAGFEAAAGREVKAK